MILGKKRLKIDVLKALFLTKKNQNKTKQQQQNKQKTINKITTTETKNINK